MAADMHTHCEASSDSTLSLSDRVALARDTAIDTVAMTDHMAVHEDLSEREQRRDGVTLVAGVEMNCTVGDTRVDVLGQFVAPHRLRERVGATTRTGVTVEDGADLDPADVIGWIHDAGGAAVLAHPGRYDLDLADLLDTLADAGIDGIETEYPYDVSPPDSPKTDVEEITRLAEVHDLAHSGGSDCHGPGYHDGPFMGTVRLASECVEELRRRSRRYQ